MLNQHMIDAFEKCRIVSQRTGTPLIEVLDRSKLLVTDQRTIELSSLVISRILDELERVGPSGFVGRKGSTPQDTFNAILSYLRTIQQDLGQRLKGLRKGEKIGTTS